MAEQAMTDKKLGRPSAFTQEIADEICERLSKGESLRSICLGERDDFMPGQTTVYRWLDENEAFRKQYTHARELQAEALADEIINIADGGTQGGVEDAVTVSRDKLRVEARKWAASKLLPKKYGDKVALTGGGEGDEPIKSELKVTFV
jgi:hypothetical protein